MKFPTSFFHSDGSGKVRYEFAQIVRMLTGRVPTGIADANALLQDKLMFKARQLGQHEQQRLRELTGELVPYFEFLGLLNEEMGTGGEATVLLLGAKVTAILHRIDVLMRCIKYPKLKPIGPVHLITSNRLLEPEELNIIREFPNGLLGSRFKLESSIPGKQPTTEAELMESLYRMLHERSQVLFDASYHISIHKDPKAGTYDCVRLWANAQPRHIQRVVAVSGPQPWGLYQAHAVARGLRGTSATDVSYIAYASQQPDILAVVEAFAKTVFELTL